MMSWFLGEEIERRRLTVETLWPVRGCLDNRLRPFVVVLGLAVGMTWSGRLAWFHSATTVGANGRWGRAEVSTE
jgi:hypothetical protein